LKLFINLSEQETETGFTLVELLCVIGIIGILASIAFAQLPGVINQARYAQAQRDLDAYNTELLSYYASRGEYPSDWEDLGYNTAPEDPWGYPYIYNNHDEISSGDRRKDGALVPINSHYDLFSPGPNGNWAPNIGADISRDDVIVAEDGAFIGKAEDY